MDFQSLSRRQLQALCKQHKIPANTTNVAMAAALRDLEEKGVCDMVIPVPATPSSCKPAVAATPGRVTRSQVKKQQQQQVDMIGMDMGNKKLFVEEEERGPEVEFQGFSAAGLDAGADAANQGASEVHVAAIQEQLEETILHPADPSPVSACQPELFEAPLPGEPSPPQLKPFEDQLVPPPSPPRELLPTVFPAEEASVVEPEEETEDPAAEGETFPVVECQLNQDPSAQVERLSHALSAVTLGPVKATKVDDKENLPLLGFERFSLRKLKKFQKELYDKKMKKVDVVPLSPNVSKNNCAHWVVGGASGHE